MTWKTHMVLGAIAGYCAYPSWKGSVIGATMALVPDIDQANSKLGNLMGPLSKMLQKGFGHRTVTHSWVILFLPFLLFGDSLATMAALWGILSHLISDMLVGRIQLLWPLRVGWLGIPVSKSMYRTVDRIVFYVAIVYIVIKGYQ
ncbi:metal-dependent hydrolase [Brevibacillus sp. HB1.3]|uniref:metal-dependent hydrolase n=1 Tax=Brevibacillus sp. HB1.3 TaxID=2738842 RepID=UPI00155568B1|nr:metal-dependent hydrolase [Brevibacillus sp. HB1.3]NQF17057.1 metal-dependent hydrolase [Brevibacillus sp. HB1.3]